MCEFSKKLVYAALFVLHRTKHSIVCNRRMGCFIPNIQADYWDVDFYMSCCFNPSLTKKSRNALDSNCEKQKIQGVFEGEGRKTGLTIWTTVMPYVDKFIFALSCKISLILKHFLGIAIPKESRISARSGSSVSQKR